MNNEIIERFLLTNFEEFLLLIRREIIAIMKAQGHVASGNFINNIDLKIINAIDQLTGQVFVEDYGRPLNTGVPASRIPFGGSRGRGGKSKFIQALIRWAGHVKRGISFKERKAFAFAVANKMKKEGMPTRGSVAFSSTGKRSGWEKVVADKVEPVFEETAKIAPMLELIFDRVIQSVILVNR